MALYKHPDLGHITSYEDVHKNRKNGAGNGGS